MENINWLDLLVISILGLFALKGIFNGFIKEIAGIVSVGLGLYLASVFNSQLATILLPYTISLSLSSSTAKVLSFVLILLGVVIIIAFVARLINTFMKATFTAWIDHLLGAFAGLIKGYLIVAVLAYLLVYFLPSAEVVRNSLTVPYLIDLGNVLLGNLGIM